MLQFFYVVLAIMFVRSEVPRVAGDSPGASDPSEVSNSLQPLEDLLTSLNSNIMNVQAQLD